MANELPQGLLEEAKNYLDITWDDAAADRKLEGILKRGMAYLNDKAGVTQDFSTDDRPKELLLDYARYARANALDEFEGNYLHEILALHLHGIAEGERTNAETEAAG